MWNDHEIERIPDMSQALGSTDSEVGSVEDQLRRALRFWLNRVKPADLDDYEFLLYRNDKTLSGMTE